MNTLYEKLLEKLEGTEYSHYFSCCCVFHNDNSPSMLVFNDGYFKCQSCGASGNLQKLWDKVNHNLSVSLKPSHHAILPHWRKWEEKYGDLDGIVHHAYHNLFNFPDYQWYFKKRKIEQFIEQGRFGYLDGWALFPVFDREGKIIDIVCRGTKSNQTRYVLHPDNDRESPYLYCPDWDKVKNSEVVYVPFGIIDAWALHGLDKAVVTGTTGKSLRSDLLKELDKRFIIIPDRYEEKDACDLVNSLGWRGELLRIKWPDGTKDTDDVRMKFGNDVLRQFIGANV